MLTSPICWGFQFCKDLAQQCDAYPSTWGFPSGSVVKNPPANAGDAGLTPGWGRSPGGGHGSPLQYCCLENPKDRRAWWLQFMGSQRAGHDWVIEHTHTHTHTHTTERLLCPGVPQGSSVPLGPNSSCLGLSHDSPPLAAGDLLGWEVFCGHQQCILSPSLPQSSSGAHHNYEMRGCLPWWVSLQDYGCPRETDCKPHRWSGLIATF